MKVPNFLPFVGRGYLKRSVKSFPTDSLYFVCSDDLPWCKKFFTTKRFPGRRFIFSDGKSVLEDLYIQTFCTHNIISNSTFSWWGAYLNSNPNKRVIFPSRWVGPDFKASPEGLYFKPCEIVKCGFNPIIYLWHFAAKCWRFSKQLVRCLRVNHQQAPFSK